MVIRQKQYCEELDSMRCLANATQAHIDKIIEINNPTKNLVQNYFVYDSIKKHKLNFVVLVGIDVDEIYNVFMKAKEKLLSIGRKLVRIIHNTAENSFEVQCLLVIGVRASSNGTDKMNYNYDLSYLRVKNLKKFWDNNHNHFNKGNCEVLISGSGDGRLCVTGLMRDSEEKAN